MNCKRLYQPLESFRKATGYVFFHKLFLNLVVLALLVGFLSGFGAVLFYYLIQFCNWLFWGPGKELMAFLGLWGIPAIGCLGGLLVGPTLYLLAREARGHGIPEVMLAVARKGGGSDHGLSWSKLSLRH